MGLAQSLTVRARGEPTNPAGSRCLRCGAPEGKLPAVRVGLPARVEVRRCADCGARTAATPEGTRWLFSCEGCGLPFLSEPLLSHGQRRCPACRDGVLPVEPPDPGFSEAIEREVRAAIASAWRFLTADPIQGYLDRIASRLFERMRGGAFPARVWLVEAEDWRTLALPSGQLLLSTGLLGAIEDEAQLAFLLGHEAGHACSGEAATRLARLGLRPGRPHDRPGGQAWLEAVEDLLRLGYGRRRERDADERAVEAALALGYDPAPAIRFLGSVQRRIEEGDWRLADYALAHPTPAYRIRHVERFLYGRAPDPAGLRINREVFLRAVRETRGRLVPASFPREEPSPAKEKRRGLLRRAAAVAAALVGLAGLAGLLALLF